MTTSLTFRLLSIGNSDTRQASLVLNLTKYPLQWRPAYHSREHAEPCARFFIYSVDNDKDNMATSCWRGLAMLRMAMPSAGTSTQFLLLSRLLDLLLLGALCEHMMDHLEATEGETTYMQTCVRYVVAGKTPKRAGICINLCTARSCPQDTQACQKIISKA